MARMLAREALNSRTSVQQHIADMGSDQGRWNQVLRHLDGDMVKWEIHVDNAAQEDVVADSQ
jgi:hypothetical protein